MLNPQDTGPQFLLNWHEPEQNSRLVSAGVGTVVVHIVLFAALMLVAKYEPLRPEPPEPDLVRHVTPLVDPPFKLTQKDTEKLKVAKEVRLHDLVPEPPVEARTPKAAVVPKKAFQPPTLPPAPKPANVPPPPELPKLEASNRPPQVQPPSVVVPAPQIQPVIQTEEKPKLAFETPGQGGTSAVRGGGVLPKIPMPANSVDEAIRSMARGGGGSGGIEIGDAEQLPSLPDAVRRNPNQPKIQSRVRLESDPMGVDFKPYLIRVLSLVRRNWLSVIPESARLGLHGNVALKFWIDRNGQVPHLEVAMPSGASALDRAAVASISASIPLPPLPAEFKGKEIVLRFTFQYN